MKRIYLDYAATTPLCREAAEAMEPWISGGFGNPSSLHFEGRRAKDAIDSARETVSETIGCLFAEVLFTGSGTESANLAILGSALEALRTGNPRRRVLLGAADHHCVIHTEETLALLGFEVDYVPVDAESVTDLEALEALLSEDVLLASVLHANNETGAIQPIAEIAELAHGVGALVHTDAVQTFLRLPWPSESDIVTFSAHKVYGPKGVGGIFLRAGVKVSPLLLGGWQEREVRAGTENVAGIVGLGAAVKAWPGPQPAQVRDALLARLTAAGAVPTVQDADRLPGHAHVRFPGVSAETLLIRLDREGVSASAGAACSSGSLEASHVLLACGYSDLEAKEGVRFSLGHGTSMEDAMEAADRIVAAVESIRGGGR